MKMDVFWDVKQCKAKDVPPHAMKTFGGRVI
jgi:hypothetical protein